MDVNRNQIFLTGLVVVLLGFEFRAMDSFVLNSKVTKLLAEQTNSSVATASTTVSALFGAEAAIPSKVVRPPDWVGWFFLSVGSVLILQSLTMAKPGG